MPVIGITGGIASGKSSFTSRLSQGLGAEVFDADAMARDLVENDPEVRLLLRERFGPSAFLENGSLDRRWVRERVFADETRRRELEAILHPAIRVHWEARVRAARSVDSRGEDGEAGRSQAGVAGGRCGVRNFEGRPDGELTQKPTQKKLAPAWLLLDIPLLYEVGAETVCDAVAVVACRVKTQVERIIARRGLAPEMARKMIASQTSLASKAARADYVVWNDAPVARLDEQAELFAGYLKLWMNLR